MPHTCEERCEVPFLRACPGLVLRQRMPDWGKTQAAGRDEGLGAAGPRKGLQPAGLLGCQVSRVSPFYGFARPSLCSIWQVTLRSTKPRSLHPEDAMQLLKRRHLPRVGAHIPKATQRHGRRSGSLLREAAHGTGSGMGAGGHRGSGSPRAPARP